MIMDEHQKSAEYTIVAVQKITIRKVQIFDVSDFRRRSVLVVDGTYLMNQISINKYQ